MSKAFLRKDWPEYELRGLVAKEFGRDKVILPVWHDITKTRLIWRLRLVKSALHAVDRADIHKWIDNFSRDSHPTEEIQIWECAAAVFLEITGEARLAKRYHKDLYRMIFAWISGASLEEILSRSAKLPKKAAEQALNAMKSYIKVGDRWEPRLIKEFEKIKRSYRSGHTGY